MVSVRVHRLLKIIVPVPLDDASFEKTARQWDRDLAHSALPPSMTPDEVETMVIFLLGKIPAELAFSVLSYLAEDSPLRGDLLEQIFDRGDTGCKVSVCLRPDLDKRLEEKCRNSPNDDVREHYQARI